MSKYIDVDKLKKYDFNEIFDYEASYEICLGVEAVLMVAEKMPTADVQEVKHSKWVKVDGDVFECFNCRRYRIHGCYIPKPRYCGNCGAKMDLEGAK